MEEKDKPAIDSAYIREDGMQDLWNVWYSELHEGQSGLTIKVNRIVESRQTDFQRIDVLDTHEFGKMLVLYGSLMVCDRDNNAYNEMLAHVPLFSHAAPADVLIIGGGDCGCLTEVLKHPEVKSCTLCEIDREVVETAKQHFPSLTAGVTDPRARLVFDDGKKFIENGREKFDIVLLDLSDPIGPAAELFQKSFHQTVHDSLQDEGIMVAQSESPFYNPKTVGMMYQNLRDIFPIVRMYTCFMPIYPSGFWSFAFCSKKYDPLADFDRARYDKLKLVTQYYNDEIHRGAFALPQFVRALID